MGTKPANIQKYCSQSLKLKRKKMNNLFYKLQDNFHNLFSTYRTNLSTYETIVTKV